MGTRYNGLPNTERMTLQCLKVSLELESKKNPDKVATPETVLHEIVVKAGLSQAGICDEKAVLKAFYAER